MYKALIKIENISPNSIQITDLSEGDEEIGLREVFITDGYGRTSRVQFEPVATVEIIETENKDLAYKFEFKATPVNTYEEESEYETVQYYVNTMHSEMYLLKISDSFYCKNLCNQDLSTQAKIFELINNIEGAKRQASFCNIFKSQKLLDYINEEKCNSSPSNNCKCGHDY